VQDHEWAIKHDSFSGTRKIEFEPIKVGRFMKDYMWSQGNKILCASATIPPNFVDEVGLSDMSIGRVDVPSTFPPERRPVITTEAVGKMTKSERDKTIPKMADQIARIADIWDGHKGIVHCNSYKIAERLYDRLPNDVQRRTRLQDGDEREESLQTWVDAPVSEEGRYRDTGGQMFLSVANDEGISLEDDQARFNIVAKASYPFVGDERVSYRLNELNDWDWYNSSALIDLQQAAGRTTRSKDDWSATYILDSSAVQLIERNEHLAEQWFLEAVDCDFDEDVVSPDNGSGVESDEGVERADDQSSLDDIADEYF
jgi:Rad3-related DNA helicase